MSGIRTDNVSGYLGSLNYNMITTTMTPSNNYFKHILLSYKTRQTDKTQVVNL